MKPFRADQHSASESACQDLSHRSAVSLLGRSNGPWGFSGWPLSLPASPHRDRGQDPKPQPMNHLTLNRGGHDHDCTSILRGAEIDGLPNIANPPRCSFAPRGRRVDKPTREDTTVENAICVPPSRLRVEAKEDHVRDTGHFIAAPSRRTPRPATHHSMRHCQPCHARRRSRPNHASDLARAYSSKMCASLLCNDTCVCRPRSPPCRIQHTGRRDCLVPGSSPIRR